MGDNDWIRRSTIRQMIERHKRRWEDWLDDGVRDAGTAVQACNYLLLDLILQYEKHPAEPPALPEESNE